MKMKIELKTSERGGVFWTVEADTVDEAVEAHHELLEQFSAGEGKAPPRRGGGSGRGSDQSKIEVVHDDD
jgi:hypothetical protein